MLRDDLDRLSVNYEDRDDHPDEWLRDRLGVACPQSQELCREILADLDPKAFGIGWWAPHPGTARRILISDCLYQALSSVTSNLVEAKLHLLELRDWYDRQNQVMADAIVVDYSTDSPRVRHPRPASAIDQLPGYMSTLHVVGCLRALNSVLDCLAAAVVGVAAFPLNIQTV